MPISKASLRFLRRVSIATFLLEALAGLWCRILIGYFTAGESVGLSYQLLLKLTLVNWFIAIIFHIIGCSLQNVHFGARSAGRGCLLVWGLITLLATLYQINSVYHLNLWQTVVAVLPMALVLLLFLRLALSLEPSSIQAAFPWRKVGSKNLTLFYLSPNSRDDMRLLLENCNDVLHKLTDSLSIETEPLNIPIFLFNELTTFQRWHKIKGEPYFAMASGNSIRVVNGPWKRLGRTVAHELTHILSWQYYGKNSITILDEGFAEHMRRELFPRAYLPEPSPVLSQPFSEPCLTPVLMQPLSKLAGQPFIDLRGDPNESNKAYYHAHALVHYLIHTRGLPAFLQIYRIASNNYLDDSETRLRLAVQEVYNESLEELEEKWRRGCSISDEGELVVPDIYSQTAIKAIRTAEQVALQQASAFVKTAHLMAGLLAQQKSIVWDILEFSTAELSSELIALHNVELNTDLSSMDKPKWSMSGRQSINYAFFEARQFGCTYVGTEHLLLGMLHDPDGEATQILGCYNITLEEFRNHTTEFYKDHKLSE